MSGAAQNQGSKSQVHTDNVQPSTKSADTTSSADAVAAAAEGGSSGDQQEASGSSERQTASPEPNCAICLGQLENKSFTDSCFHMFCFVCLQEWSKVKAECPLCKQPFKSIIHNVKSYNNYDQFYLDHHHPHQRPPPPRYGFRFEYQYRATIPLDHRYFNVPEYQFVNLRDVTSRDHSLPIYRRSIVPRYRLRSRTVDPLAVSHAAPVTTANFRRQIYETGRRVSGLRATHRRRTVSPNFFRSNPAQTHRLVPWLNRELNALLYNVENQVTFVLELIMDLIKRFPIDSDEFYEHIHPYLHHNTRHFMHEFLYFARSPYTMQTYDTKAIYEEHSHTMSSSGSSNDNSDDVVVVVDDDEEEDSFRPHRSYSPWCSPQTSGTPHSLLARSRWDSPTPGPSWDLGGNSSHSPVTVEDSSVSDASTIIDPTYIEDASSQPARDPSPDISDGEEVIFVSYDKPWEERSPIQLSSDSDDESSRFLKTLKQENKKRKKARPLASVLETDHQSRNRDRSRPRSRSLTPPMSVQQRSRSHHSPSTHDHHASSSSKNKQDRHHKRRRHHDGLEVNHHSSRPSRKEKRKSSHSQSRSPFKKSRHDKTEKDGDREVSDSNHKKHKLKKHKKNKERSDKHTKKRMDSHRIGTGLEASGTATSSTSTERVDHCKKHPSGHKKSRIRNTGDGHETEAKEGSSGHHSDGLLSDTSTSSGNSTVTTTSLTDTESSSTRYFSRQQRVQQVLQERQRQAYLSMLPSIMDLAPSWENITRLSSMLSSHTASQLAAVPGPSQSSSDPVIISTSSDESDIDVGRMTNDSMHVAKTVVVPCSSNPEVPTAAIDFASGSASISGQRPVMMDNYIDVESITSEEEMSNEEVVDLESLEDTEDSNIEAISSSKAQEPKAKSSNTKCLTEVSAEMDQVTSPCASAAVKPPVSTSSLPFSIESILNRDVFMGVNSSSQLLSRPASNPCSFGVSMTTQDFVHSRSQSLEAISSARYDAQLDQRAVNVFPTLGQFSALRQLNAVQTPLFPAVLVQSTEGQARNHFEGNVSNLLNQEIRSATSHYANDYKSTTCDWNDSDEEIDPGFDADSHLATRESGIVGESKDEEIDVVGLSVQSAEFSNNGHGNDGEEAGVEESLDDVQETAGHRKDKKERIDVLNNSVDTDLNDDEKLSIDLDETDAEKLSLSAQRNACFWSDQDENVEAVSSLGVGSNQVEKYNDCKPQSDNETSSYLLSVHCHSDSPKSHTSTSLIDCLDPEFHSSFSDNRDSTSCKSETRTDTAIKMDSSLEGLNNSSSDFTPNDSTAEHLVTCVGDTKSGKTSIRQVDISVNGHCPAISSDDHNHITLHQGVFENNSDHSIPSQNMREPAKLQDAAEHVNS